MVIGNSNLESARHHKHCYQMSVQCGERQFIFSMSRRSKVSSESLFLRGVAIKPPIHIRQLTVMCSYLGNQYDLILCLTLKIKITEKVI